MRYFESQSEWLHQQVGARSAEDPYWRQVNYLLQRLAGMRDGQFAGSPSPDGHPLDWATMLLMQAWPDLEEIKIRMDGKQIGDLSHGDHCTVLLKLVGKNLVM